MASFDIVRKNGDVYPVLVDDEDFERVMAAGPWNVQLTKEGHVYLKHTLPRPTRGSLILHRFVVGALPGEYVDHVDASRSLDNRKKNLRRCTNAQNGRNQRLRKCSVSGLKGASFCARTGRWIAQITVDRSTVYLGQHDSAEEAHRAYCEASARLHGAFGRTA